MPGRKPKASRSSYSPIKENFKQKLVRRDKESHYILIKRAIQEEDVATLNIHAPNVSVPKFIKQILLSIKEQIGPDIIIVEDLNTLPTSLDKISRPKIKKDILGVNTTDEIDLINIYRIINPSAVITQFSQ
jgi:hypothetical protein